MSAKEAGRAAPTTMRVEDRVGQLGDTWGNLLLPEGAAAVDERIAFPGDAAVYRVGRVNGWPLDATKRLYYYERVDRSAVNAVTEAAD
ncbi:MAG: hypothetical protein JNK60_21170 [Acidobacteria bacterium]|nr:hypothetical protein [Acidobacteriota bacterium]